MKNPLLSINQFKILRYIFQCADSDIYGYAKDLFEGQLSSATRSLTSLIKLGLIERPKRGEYKMTEIGKELCEELFCD